MGKMIDLIETDAGTMCGYRALPPAGRGAAVIVLQEIFGANAAMRAVADDLAAAGYVAVVPDLFRRIEPGVDLGYGEDDMQRAFALWKAYDFDQGVKDVVATLAAVRAMPEVESGAALLGFCMGGQLAVCGGAESGPDAVVSFYGTALGDHLDAVRALAMPTMFHFGDQDQHVPEPVREAVRVIAADKPDMTVEIYPGAGHGFFNSFRPQGFDPAAHDLAWQRTLALLAKALGAKR